MMNIRSFKYHVKEGVKGLFKNRRMSIASIVSVAACIAMLIISLCMAINIAATLEKIEENIGISIYLGEAATSSQAKELYDQLEKIENVSNITYMSKEDALGWAKEQWGEDNVILQGLEEDNPFPRSFEIEINGLKNQDQVIQSIEKIQKEFEIKLLTSSEIDRIHLEQSLDISNLETDTQSANEAYEAEDAQTTEEDLEKKVASTVTEKINAKDYSYQGIEKIKHSKKESELLISLNTTIRIVGIILMLVLAAISVVIITNTIKMAVEIRREEINIMKYVGATDSFIRWPFIIEGILIGVIGATIPSVICFFMYTKVNDIVYESLSIFMNYIEFKSAFNLFLVIIPISLILGALLGTIGSVNSIKKHLDV